MSRCPEIEDLIAAGSEGASLRRSHLDGCPRCRALLASYEQFLRGGPMAGMDVAAAGSSLRAALAGALRTEGLGRPSGAGTAREGRSPFLLIRRIVFDRGLRPVLATGAAAVVVLIAGSVVMLRQQAGEDDPGLLRGGTAGIEDPFAPAASIDAGKGNLRFTWRRQPGADGYALLFLRSDLTEAGRIEAGVDTSLEVGTTAIPGAVKPGEVLLWRVLALQEGDEIGRSAAAGLRAP